MTQIEDDNILEKEIMPPKEFLQHENNFKYIAYPFWKYNDKVIGVVKKYFIGGLSGNGYSNETKWAIDAIKMQNKILH